MSLAVDTAAVRSFVENLQMAGFRQMVLLFGLDGHTDQQAVEAVRGILGTGGDETVSADGEYLVYATHGGAGVSLPDCSRWQALVERVAAALESVAGHVTTLPMVDHRGTLIGRWGTPSLLLAPSTISRITDLPVTQVGLADRVWNVGTEETSACVRAVVPWALDGVLEGEVQVQGGIYPVDTSGGLWLLDQHLPLSKGDVQIRSFRTPHEFRSVTFWAWGQVGLAAVAAEPLSAVSDYRRIMTTMAEHLDVACVGWATPTLARWADLDLASTWERARDEWKHFVVAPQALQLVTSSHLEKAHDLRAWNLTQISDDRWLLEWPDLDEWFGKDPDHAFAPPQQKIHAAAREHFGRMVWDPSC